MTEATLDAAGKLEVKERVRSLAVPAVVQSLLNTAVLFSDTLMVGWLGATSLAAVALSGPVLWTSRSLIFALCRGTVALVARDVGAGDRAHAAQVARESLALLVVLGALGGWALAGVTRPIFLFLGAEETVATAGRSYLGVLLMALPVSLASSCLQSVFQASGDTRTPMRTGLVANVLHVTSNYVLMFGAGPIPALGVLGAAISTAGAWTFQMLVLSAILWRRGDWMPIFVRTPASVPWVLPDVMRVAWPAFLEMVAFHSAYVFFCRLVGNLGTDALAAHQVALAVEALSFMPAEGFSIAAATISGQYLGARRPEAARFGLHNAIMRAVLWMVPLMAAFWIVPESICGFFTSDPQVIERASLILRIAAFELPLLGAAAVMTGGLQGAGDTRSPFYAILVCAWCVRLPGTWLLAHHWGLGIAGVWIATTLDWLLRMTLLGVVVARGRWSRVPRV